MGLEDCKLEDVSLVVLMWFLSFCSGRWVSFGGDGELKGVMFEIKFLYVLVGLRVVWVEW